MSIPLPTDTDALANRINFHTRDAHNKIDKTMSLKIGMALRHSFIYSDLLRTYYTVFSTLEKNIDNILEDSNNPANPILSQFFIDKFRRTSQLRKDLEFLQVDMTEWIPPAQLKLFVKYINDSIEQNPLNVLAYCHVLYLALFAGGRVVRSSITKNFGFLPNYNGVSSTELVKNATHFFTFDTSRDLENKLKWEYKKNYELATRNALTEEQKLMVIDTARDVFQWNWQILMEINDTNKKQLTQHLSFKLLTFLVEEWKFNDTVISKNQKRLIIYIVVSLQILLFVTVVKSLLR